MMNLLSFLLAFFLLFLTAAAPATASASAGELGALINSHAQLVGGGVSVYIRSLKTGKEIYSYRPDLTLAPASNMKVITSAAAFMQLGPNFRYLTLLKGQQPPASQAIVRGSVYLVGSGDPTFMEGFYDDPLSPFHRMAAQLYQAGVRTIEGDIVGNDRVFDREFIGVGWKDRYLMNAYAAPCGGLSLNGNLMELLVNCGSVIPFPSGAESQISRKRDIQNRFYVTRSDRSIIVGGRLPPSFHCTFPVMNPSLFTTKAFSNVLRCEGVTVKGRTRLVTSQELPSVREKAGILAAWSSPPLQEIVHVMNRMSHNFIAEQVFRTLGVQKHGVGSSDRSRKAVFAFMHSAGIRARDMVVADGSGLSVSNRISSRQLAGVLAYMYRSPYRHQYLETLAQPGKMGTLRHRLRGFRLFAKTGSIREVSSLSGILETPRKELVVFAIITNHPAGRLGNAKTVENRIVELLSKQ